MKAINLRALLSIASLVLLSIASSDAQVYLRTDFTTPIYSYRNGASQVTTHVGYGAKVGFDFETPLSGDFYLVPGVLCTYNSSAIESLLPDIAGLENLNEICINVPLRVQYQFDLKPDKLAMFVYAGPELTFNMLSRSVANFKVAGHEVRGTYDYYNGNTAVNPGKQTADLPDGYAEFIQDRMDVAGVRHKRVEIRLDAGIGLRIAERYSIILGYTQGLSNKYDNDTASKLTDSNLYLGLRFRLRK